MYKLIEFIRRIYVVLLFIVIEAIALNYYAHSSYYTQAKILSYANRVTGSVQSTFFGIKHFFTLRRENDMLTARVAELEGRLSAYREMAAAAQTDSLAAAIAADTLGVGLEGMSQYRYMTARTVANSINRDRNFITLNRGLMHGVMTDMAVITPDGAMVGYVVGCSERYSVVLPLLNTDFRTSGKIVGDDHFGSISWSEPVRGRHDRAVEVCRDRGGGGGRIVGTVALLPCRREDRICGELRAERQPDGIRCEDTSCGRHDASG